MIVLIILVIVIIPLVIGIFFIKEDSPRDFIIFSSLLGVGWIFLLSYFIFKIYDINNTFINNFRDKYGY